MKNNFFTIIVTIINFSLLFIVVIAIYNAIKWLKNKNKMIDNKLDIIVNKLSDKESK